MTKVQQLLAKRRKLERERAEKRAALGNLALLEERTDEQNTESRAIQERLPVIESEWLETDTAIGEAGGEERFETRGAQAEYSRLVAGASVGAIFAASIEKRATAGETAELQQHYKLGSNQVPLVMLRNLIAEQRWLVEHGIETRAVSPAPTEAGATADVPGVPVFVGGLADYFGIYQPEVAVGEAAYSVLTSAPAVGGPHDDSTDAPETDGTWGSYLLKPKRLQASFIYRRTDAAAIVGMDEALRLALSGALSEANDQEIVDQIVTDVGRTAAGAADTYASVASRFGYAPVDGRHAQQESDLRLLVGSATLADWGALNTDGRSAVQNVRDIVGGVRVSPLIAGVSGNKQDVLARKGSARDMVAPIWSGVTIIVDEVSGSGKGEIEITAVAMSDRKVLRTGGFARIQAQHA